MAEQDEKRLTYLSEHMDRAYKFFAKFNPTYGNSDAARLVYEIYDKAENSVEGLAIRKSAEAIFKEIQTYEDLQWLMIAYLKGLLKINPWYIGPVDPETIPLLDNLLRINAYGFISVGSQPGTCEDNLTAYNTGEKYDLQQRGYIQGLLPNIYLGDLIEALINQDVVIIRYQYNDRTKKTGFKKLYLKGEQLDDFSVIDQKLSKYSIKISWDDDPFIEVSFDKMHKDVNEKASYGISLTESHEYDSLFRLVSDKFKDWTLRHISPITLIRIPRCKEDLITILDTALKKVVKNTTTHKERMARLE